jgi:hypothetical protein
MRSTLTRSIQEQTAAQRSFSGLYLGVGRNDHGGPALGVATLRIKDLYPNNPCAADLGH